MIDLRDKDGWTALHWAAATGNLKVVKTLMSHGEANQHIKDHAGLTASDLASKLRYGSVAAWLDKHNRHIPRSDGGRAHAHEEFMKRILGVDGARSMRLKVSAQRKTLRKDNKKLEGPPGVVRAE